MLRDAFDWAAAGQGRVVFTTGKPGISLVACGEAVIRLIRLLGAGAGLEIVLEDLHWADNRGCRGHRSCRR